MEFAYSTLPWNILFGAGYLSRLPQELNNLGFSKALILTTHSGSKVGQETVRLLGQNAAGLFDQARMHVPIETVDRAIELARELNADCTITIGGGSTTGLGKALCLKIGLPYIAIPTTYAGSEMTNIWGITENGRKVTGRDNAVVPRLTIYDPELTLDLPIEISTTSGMNALAQAVVNIATKDANPMVSTMACAAVKALAKGLPAVAAAPGDLSARSEVLYGASLAGGSLGTGSTGLHHRLCHTFGGTFNTPHAQTHSILLPYTIAFNSAETVVGTALLAEVLGVEDPARAIFELGRTIGTPTALRELGIVEADLDTAASIATESPIHNSERATFTRVRDLLQHAWLGTTPECVVPSAAK